MSKAWVAQFYSGDFLVRVFSVLGEHVLYGSNFAFDIRQFMATVQKHWLFSSIVL